MVLLFARYFLGVSGLKWVNSRVAVPQIGSNFRLRALSSGEKTGYFKWMSQLITV